MDKSKAWYPMVMDNIAAFLHDYETVTDDPGEVARVIDDVVAQAQPPLRVPVGRVGAMSAEEWIRRRLTKPWAVREREWADHYKAVPPTNDQSTS
ncbi:MAG: hypothetical protein C7B45_05895 [Sulfobacillus acidophilus]|uniref:Uncharacterized protein n=1 Tax=Sulfobacillus acidophilus TaxID=53633 RepID=A0A2T2WKF8_9FIRM|nr:MAG: hypothetical protein C7B45_05895 [Sulfobacillus acidophilus]